MKYLIECPSSIVVVDTYREAEIFCGMYGIHCENIYEVSEEEL